MKYVDPEEIVDYVSSEMRKALKDAVQDVLPGAQFDEYALFRSFRRAVGRQCNKWEQVPDNCCRE